MSKHPELAQAIEALEAQRSALGDAVVDASIAALRQQLAELNAAPPLEQRKLVTILFADLAGWTRMASTMDPEDVQAIQQAYFQAVTAPIEQYGGSVEKYIGDAVLAVFGVPQAHENDPERAVRASLAMQAAMAPLNDRLAAAAPPATLATLSLRIGIHTGLVVSRVGASGDFVVTGDAVNLASRLQSAAQPGTVLLSGETLKLVGHAFEADTLPPLQVKGKAEPVAAFRVLAAKPLAPKRRGIPGLDSPLVGRQVEMAALDQAMERLQRGVGGIVTIMGEAGIGKSRLVAELRNSQLRDRHQQLSTEHRSPITANWFEGRCLSHGGTTPYLLWLDVLHSALGVTLDDAPEQVQDRLQRWLQNLCPDRFADVYPYLARLMSLPLDAEALAVLSEMDGQVVKHRTFQAAKIALTSAAQRQPLAIKLEDLHWADPSSLELLQHLLPLADQAALLLICVFRPYVDHGSWRIREEVARDFGHCHTDLWLQPLSPADSEDLVANLLRVDTLPQDLHLRILGRTGGNPFFVEEVIHTLIDLQAIAYDPASGRWQVTRDLAEVPIPETLQGVLVSRIDRLQAETRQVLQLASVIGRIFLYRVLVAIAEEERDLEGKLATLQREELIRERAHIPELEYIFRHELTREAAYNGILKRQRRQFHRQVAEALEQLYPERLDGQVARLAHHFAEAGELQRAVPYGAQAARQAQAAYANASAVYWYEQVLSWLDRLDAGQSQEFFAIRFDSLLNLGHVVELSGAWEAAGEHYEAARALAAAMGAAESLVYAQIAIGELYRKQGNLDEAEPWFAQALETAERLDDRPGVAKALSCTGTVELLRGDYDSAQADFDRSLAIRRELQDRHHEAILLNNLGIIAARQGDPQRAQALFAESLDLRRELGDKWEMANSLNNLGQLNLQEGRYPQAQEYLEEALAILREIGAKHSIGLALLNLANVQRSQGQYAGARGSYRESLQLARELGDQWLLAYLLDDIGGLLSLQGQSELGLRLAGAGSALHEATGAPLSPPDEERLDAALAPARDALGEEAASAAWEAGRGLSLEEAVNLALSAGRG